MENYIYPGYWSIDRRAGETKVIYRMTVVDVDWYKDEQVTDNVFKMFIFREDERKLTWLLGTQNEEPEGVLRFKGRELPHLIEKVQAELDLLLPLPVLDTDNFEKVFGNITDEGLGEDFQAGISAHKKVLCDKDELLAHQHKSAMVKFLPVIRRRNKLVSIKTGYEPEVPVTLNINIA